MPDNLDAFAGYQLAYVDATQIALKNDLGTRTLPLINTAMIGAFARMMNEPPMPMIEKAIQEEIGVKAEDNFRASKMAYDGVTVYGKVD